MELTISQAATALDINRRTVRNICACYGIGRLVNRRLRLVTKSDLPQIAKLKKPVGNPNFGRRKSNGD